MTYPETLAYLYGTLPVFQRIGAAAYKNDLTNTYALCEALGNPQTQFKSIHIAGTNGKGSSSHMTASILQSEGYKTGLYTSPHLKEFTERIKIGGHEVTQEFVVDFVDRIRPHLERIRPSFFETTVAMAYDYFARERVDLAVIEVGLGGRLDSTNVITPLVSLITNIGYDHQDLLGDTLQKIASEKAGIIKPGVPAVVSERQSEVENVFIKKAADEQSPLTFASEEYQLYEQGGSGVYRVVQNGKERWAALTCELKGRYQRKNIPGVLTTIDKLQELGIALSEKSICEGIAQVASRTGLKGRWQKLGDHPLVICDVGHNQDGIREVVAQLRTVPHEQLHIVFGVVKDKDVAPVLALLPREAHYYFCEARLPRALPAATLGEQARQAGLRGRVVPAVNDAVREAIASAGERDLVFIGGSTFVVAEVDQV
jgi:dihydrofolate synthase/folylpolyglutamate synthase